MKQASGFTLLELLVALVVVAILAAAVVSAFATGLKAWDRVQQQADYHQTATAILDTIGADLQRAWLGVGGKGFFKLEQANAGGNSSLAFTTLAPVKDGGGLSQFVVVSYRLEGDQLLRSQQSLLALAEATPAEEIVVAEAVGEFKLRAAGDDDWQEQWVVPSQTATVEEATTTESSKILPKQVEINIFLTDTALGKSARLRTVAPIDMGHP
jgi:general secretion pathway protein J